MKPDMKRFFDVAAAHLMMKTAPALGGGYEQSSVGVLGAMLIEAGVEFERAASRRVEENAALRGLFAHAAPVVTDRALREKLEAAARGEDGSLAISNLERVNGELRALLIELHACVEGLDSAEARRVESAIWAELVASTQRRRIMLGPF